MTAVCDVYQPRIDNAQAECGSNPKGYQDFRKLLEDKNVDAVVISTPDHWHALQTIMACAAGKDVYVEKPMTLFVKEGRWMTTAARRYKRIVCVGTQGRNGSHIKDVVPLFRDGLRRQDLKRAIHVVPQHHAGLRQTGGLRSAAGTRLRPVARSGAGATVQPEPLSLSLPLVLGLLGRADDQPRRARYGPRALSARRQGAEVRLLDRRPLRAAGQRRDSRHAGRRLAIRRLHRRGSHPGGERRPNRVAGQRAAWPGCSSAGRRASSRCRAAATSLFPT